MDPSNDVVETPAAEIVASGDTPEPVAIETPAAPSQPRAESSPITDKVLQKMQMELANLRKSTATLLDRVDPAPADVRRAQETMESLQSRMDAYNVDPGNFVIKEIAALRADSAQMREELEQSRMETDRLKWQQKTGLTSDEQDECLQQAVSDAEDFTDPAQRQIAVQALFKLRMQQAAKLKDPKPAVKASVLKPAPLSAQTQGATRISVNAAAVTPVSTIKPRVRLWT